MVRQASVARAVRMYLGSATKKCVLRRRRSRARFAKIPDREPRRVEGGADWSGRVTVNERTEAGSRKCVTNGTGARDGQAYNKSCRRGKAVEQMT